MRALALLLQELIREHELKAEIRIDSDRVRQAISELRVADTYEESGRKLQQHMYYGPTSELIAASGKRQYLRSKCRRASGR